MCQLNVSFRFGYWEIDDKDHISWSRIHLSALDKGLNKIYAAAKESKGTKLKLAARSV